MIKGLWRIKEKDVISKINEAARKKTTAAIEEIIAILKRNDATSNEHSNEHLVNRRGNKDD